ncbi:MAG: FAD-dependent oxidoreductase [Geminicoccaceae bacterium]
MKEDRQVLKHLFQPLTIRHRTLRHRLNFGAHTANMAEGGLPGERHLGYYRERAMGGAAMIVVEPVPVHPSAILTRGNFLAGNDAVIPGFRRITEACHAFGTVMIQQLYSVGQHGDMDISFHPAWSPSGLPSYHDSDGSHAMSIAEIEEMIEAFGQAARRAHESGFDGVELFAAYHALIDQFWTPWSNRREDEWGGSLDNRTRFSTRIIERVRQLCGEDFIIGMAVSADPDVAVALSVENLQEIVAWHDARGLIDYVTCGTGSYFDFHKLIPTVLYEDKLGAPFAEALKQVARHVRVQAESHIRTPENADTVIGAGQADMVSIVRGQIADPHMATKAAEGRLEDIRPCLSCNQKCWGRRYRDLYISCVINPSTGHEFLWGGDRFEPASAPKRVLVVGGGPAGLECARVAAERGHRVILAEAGAKLGGQFRLAGAQPRRAQIQDYIDWQERQLARLQVEIRLNTFVEEDELGSFDVEVLVVATGSLPRETGFQRALPAMEAMPGADRANVHAIQDVMSREARCGKRVVIVDEMGHWHGPGTAWHLAEAGHEVVLVASHPSIAARIAGTSADWPLRRKLKALGVRHFVEHAVKAWDGDAAILVDLRDGEEIRIEADTLVLATATGSVADLAGHAIASIETHIIGDAVAPRLADMAIHEGRVLGLKL